MGWGAAIAYIFKLIGEILELKAKNELTQEKFDAIVRIMKEPRPPK